jgi:hypothetical protein
MSGAVQSQGTCWLFSIINQFVLSDGMLRVLKWNMENQYSKMTPDEKEFFDAPMDTVCPLGSRFNKIYFYKFLDQYTCLQGGPGQLRKKAGKSANLLKRFSGAGNNYRADGGLKSSFHTPELFKALETLDISTYSHRKCLAFPQHFAKEANEVFVNPNDQFVICYISPKRVYPVFDTKGVEPGWTAKSYPRTIKIGTRLFDLASAGIGIHNNDYKGLHAGHIIIGYVDSHGKGYLFDSNQMSNYVQCDWWDPKKLEKTIRGPFISGKYPQFAGTNINAISYSNFTYVRRTFASMVPLTCRLKYRRLNFNTRAYMGYQNMNQLKNVLTRKIARGELTQAERAKIIKNFQINKLNTSKYMGLNMTPLKNSIKNLPQEKQNKIIKNYKKLTNFNVRNYLNTSNSVLNYQVQAGGMTVAQRKKIADAKKLIITFEFLKQMNINKNTISNFEEAGYIVTEDTKRKVKRFLAKRAGGSLTPSPNPNRTGFTPSPPRKRRPSIINLRTPTPVRSNPRTPTPRQRTPSRSNLDKAKSAVAKLKTIVARKAYKRTRAVNMSQANWTELGRYINSLNYQKRKKLENARQLKKKAKN